MNGPGEVLGEQLLQQQRGEASGGREQRPGDLGKAVLMLAKRSWENGSGLLLTEQLWLGVNLGEETTNIS